MQFRIFNSCFKGNVHTISMCIIDKPLQIDIKLHIRIGDQVTYFNSLLH